MIIPISYSWGRGAKDRRPQQRTVENLAALRDALFADAPDLNVPDDEVERKNLKSNAPLTWIAQPMGGDGTRSGANGLPWPLFLQDIDGVNPPIGEAPMDLLKRYLVVVRSIVTSFGWCTVSHQEDTPRARIVWLLDRPVNSREAKRLATVLNTRLTQMLGVLVGPQKDAAIHLDPSMQDAAHIAFGPLKGCTQILLHEGAQPLPVDEWLAATPEMAPGTPPTNATAGIPCNDVAVDELRVVLASLDVRMPDAVNDRPTWIKVLCSLKAYNWPDEVMRPIARDWSSRSLRFDPSRWDQDWESLSPDGGITPRTLHYLAGGVGADTSVFTGEPMADTEKECPPLETDDGMACRFSEWLHGRAMFARGMWHVWTDAYWKPDAPTVEALLKDFASEQLDRIADAHSFSVKTGDETAIKRAQRELKAAQTLLNQRRQLDVLRSASVMLRRNDDELNAQPDLLACPNGTVDLQTGRMLPADPALGFTMCAGVAYNPSAMAPRWEQFISEVFPAQEEAAYLQRWCGYMLTGHVREEAMAVWYGNGANGKSVLGDILARLLGDFAIPADASLLVGRSLDRGNASPEIARLADRRLCYVNESKVGDKLNDATVKALVSTEQLTARRLYGSPFEFYPSAKIVLRTNHKPIVTDDSDGIWRRLHLLSFAQRFDGARRDPKLLDTLKMELPGILAWCVRGAIQWYREGLRPPTTVLNATAEYRSDSDDLSQWLAERTEPGGFTSIAELSSDFARTMGLRSPPTTRRFCAMLRDRGCIETRTAAARGYALSLRPESHIIAMLTRPPLHVMAGSTSMPPMKEA